MAQRQQIRALTVALVAMFAIVLGFQAWILGLGHQRVIEHFSTRAANRAHATANQVAAALRQIDLLLLDVRGHVDGDEVLRGPGSGNSARAAAMGAMLRERMARHPLVLWLHVVSANGRPMFSSLDEVPRIDISDHSYFKDQREAARDELVVPDVMLSRSTGNWTVLPCRRLSTADGRFAGIVLASIDTDALGAVLTAVDQQQWTFALFDRTGRLAARRPHRPEQIGQLVDADLRKAAGPEAESSVLRAPALGEAETMIWASKPVADMPLVTVAGFRESIALEQWQRDLRVHLVVAVLLGIGVFSILLLHRRNLRAADALRASEAYYRTLFDASPDAIAVIEAGRVIDANRCYGELFRVVEGHAIAPWDMAPATQPDGSATIERGRRLSADTMDSGLQRSSWRCQRSDGSQFDAEIVVTRFRHMGRDLLVAITRDLTVMRELEDKLRQGQKLEALGQLAGGVAHDFNNMLAAIIGSAEIIAIRATDERIMRYNSTIISAAERASQLTRKLLSFARKGKILSSPVDLHQLLRETVGLLERTIDPRVVISLRLEAPSAAVVGDPAQVQNALLNLCLNARDAMPQGGSLILATRIVSLEGEACRVGSVVLDAGEYVQIAVSDTGTGIAATDLNRIFDPFFTTKEVGKGTGLGLASVYGTMVSHKGAVTVVSDVGRGTTFNLYFPCGTAQADELPREQDKPTGKGLVLVIDDEDMVRTAMAMQLEDLGYTPMPAGNVEEAEISFRSRHSELVAVLLDVVMPRVSGVDVAARLRGIDPQIPIILVSGFPRNAEVKQLIEMGVAGFLQKPFRQAELAQALARLRRDMG